MIEKVGVLGFGLVVRAQRVMCGLGACHRFEMCCYQSLVFKWIRLKRQPLYLLNFKL